MLSLLDQLPWIGVEIHSVLLDRDAVQAHAHGLEDRLLQAPREVIGQMAAVSGPAQCEGCWWLPVAAGTIT
jgi:hypothetical protein